MEIMVNCQIPRVSICIPTYNYGRFIADAIESVLAQTYIDFELIISDNCSDDDTGSIVQEYLLRDQRVAYYRNSCNLGMVGNWNRCLELARGEYVKILCADDLLAPTCLERSVELMEADPRTVLVSTSRRHVDEFLRPLTHASFSPKMEFLPGGEVIRRCLFRGNLIGEPTAVLFRNLPLNRGFSTEYRHIVDLEMWFSVLGRGYFAHTPEVLCSFRQHAAQTTGENIISGRFIADEFLLVDEYCRIPSIGLGYVGWQRARYRKARLVWNEVKRHPDLPLRKDLQRHYSLLLFAFISFLAFIVRPFRKV